MDEIKDQNPPLDQKSEGNPNTDDASQPQPPSESEEKLFSIGFDPIRNVSTYEATGSQPPVNSVTTYGLISPEDQKEKIMALFSDEFKKIVSGKRLSASSVFRAGKEIHTIQIADDEEIEEFYKKEIFKQTDRALVSLEFEAEVYQVSPVVGDQAIVSVRSQDKIFVNGDFSVAMLKAEVAANLRVGGKYKFTVEELV